MTLFLRQSTNIDVLLKFPRSFLSNTCILLTKQIMKFHFCLSIHIIQFILKLVTPQRCNTVSLNIKIPQRSVYEPYHCLTAIDSC